MLLPCVPLPHSRLVLLCGVPCFRRKILFSAPRCAVPCCRFRRAFWLPTTCSCVRKRAALSQAHFLFPRGQMQKRSLPFRLASPFRRIGRMRHAAICGGARSVPFRSFLFRPYVLRPPPADAEGGSGFTLSGYSIIPYSAGEYKRFFAFYVLRLHIPQKITVKFCTLCAQFIAKHARLVYNTVEHISGGKG